MKDLLTQDFSNDILQMMPEDRLPKYIELCKQNIPHAIHAHHFLVNHQRWQRILSKDKQLRNTISPRCKNFVFVHRNGNVENCTFVVVTQEAYHDDVDESYIYAFTLQDSCEELNECFWYTKRVSWDFKALVISFNTEHVSKMNKFFNFHNYELKPEISDICMWLPKEKAELFSYTIPDDIYLGGLNLSHAKTINDEWPLKTAHSLEYIKSIITLNGGIGLFDKNTHELLSWVLTNENLIPGCLQTKVAARGKGLGKLIMKIYCKKYAEEENLDLFVFIVRFNNVSQNLFASLGFTVFETTSAMQIADENKYDKYIN